MEKKIPLARKEKRRRPMLLAGAGDSSSRDETNSRDQGQEISSNAQGDERPTPRTAEKKSKDNAEAKGRGRRGRKRGLHYSVGKVARDIEGANRPSGRSAQELGIELLDSRCELSPSKAHWLIGKTEIDNGTIFRCKYCMKVTWLPNGIDECVRLSHWLQVYGLNGGYQRILDFHPAAKRLLSKVQDIFYLRKSIPEDIFPLTLAAVMLDREYPHDVEITEEEVL